MPLQNILPSYQAEEKSAQMQLHPVRMPSHLDGIGRMLTDAGQGLQGAGASLALSFKQRHDRLQEREDNLLLTEKTNAFTAEAAKAFQELSTLKGKEASGATQKYSDTVDKLMNSFGAGMNPKNSRAFRINATRIANSYLLRMMDHEDGNIRQADMEAASNGIAILSDKYAEDGKWEDFIAGVTPLYVQWYSAKHGAMPSEEELENLGRRFNPKTGKMDGEPKNEGWHGRRRMKNGGFMTEVSVGIDGVETPLINPYTTEEDWGIIEQIASGEIDPSKDPRADGVKDKAKKWADDRMAEGKSPFYNGDKEDQPLRKITDEQKALERRSSQFKTGFDNILEEARGKAFDSLIKKGDIAGAEEYFNSIKDELQPGTRTNMQTILQNKGKDLLNNTKASAHLSDIVAAGHDVSGGKYDMSQGGRYYTDSQGEAFARIDYELATSDDPDAPEVRRLLHTMYQAKVALQKANLGHDLGEAVGDLFQDNSLAARGRDIQILKSRYTAMPPSVLKDMVGELISGQEQSYTADLMKQWSAFEKATTAQQKARKDAYDEWKKGYDQMMKDYIADPNRKALASSVLLEVSHIATKDGRLKIMGFDVNIHNKQEREAFLALASTNTFPAPGFITDEEAQQIRDIAEGRIPSGLRMNATNDIAKAMNKFDPEARNAWTPGLVSVVMPELTNSYMDWCYKVDQSKADKDAKDKAKEMKLVQLLMETRQKPGMLWGWNDVVAANFYQQAIGPNGLPNVEYMESEFKKFRENDEYVKKANAVLKVFENAILGNDKTGYREVITPGQ